MGAWVETHTAPLFMAAHTILLPTWERELKQGLSRSRILRHELLSTWERELKRVWATILVLRRKSLPVWERELKPSLLKCFTAAIYYRFLHGSVSWNSDKTFKSETLSALMILRNSLVAPCVEAWVETKYGTYRPNTIYTIAPSMGAWIETPENTKNLKQFHCSLRRSVCWKKYNSIS